MKSFMAELWKNTIYHLPNNLYISKYPIFLKFSPQFVILLPSKAACSDTSKLTEQWIFCLEKETILPNHSTNQIRTQLKIF